MTGDLKKHVWQHREGALPGFSRRYNVTKLVYFETFSDVTDAVARGKQIKKGKRQRKTDLVKSADPEWRDLFEDLRYRQYARLRAALLCGLR